MASISSSSSNSKKRARHDEQEHDEYSSEVDDDIIEVNQAKSTRSNGSKAFKTAPRQSVASTSSSSSSSNKSKQPAMANGSKKAIVPVTAGKTKVKGVNDALKDFQATFGLSSPSSSTSKAATGTPARPPASKNAAKSTPSLGRTTFRNSFGNQDPAQTSLHTRAETPVRNAAPKVPATSKPLVSSFPVPAPATHRSIPPRTSNKTTASIADATDGTYEEGSELLAGEGSERDEQEDDEHAQRLRAARKGKKRADPGDDADDDMDTDSVETGHVDRLPETLGKTASRRTEGPGSHKHARVSSLSELSAKKKMYSLPVDATTPSKPSPLASSTIHQQRLGTESLADGDIKPLRALGALNAFSSTTTDSNQMSETGQRSSTFGARFANISSSSAAAGAPIRDLQQDVTELLSPRKKRKGWVPAGHAENAAGVIKRFQTGSNLWIHEISRTLDTFGKSNAGGTGAGSAAGKVKKESLEQQEDAGMVQKGRRDGKRTYEQLLKDLNPHLRLEIIEVLSPKPASLTWSSAEGGFITAGAAEKLLITRCKILKDDETSAAALGSQQADGEQSRDSLAVPLGERGGPPLTPGSAAAAALEQQIEGLVIFSLAGHSRTSTGITLARKEQERPHRDEPAEGGANTHGTGEDVNGQQRLRFGEVAGKPCTLFVPASIADLHVQMRAGDQVWTWEPWSVVDLVDMPSLAGSAMHRRTTTSEEFMANEQAQGGQTSQKALLISRFGVIL